jgi:hypothetical protein
MEWVELTVSNGHFLDEITAALRDAQIELRLSDPISQPQRGVRTTFGVRQSESQVIEVPRERLAEAQALLREIFDDAEAAAVRESGAAAPTAEEREEEASWRAEMERERAGSLRRTRWVAGTIVGVLAAAILLSVVLNLFMR